MDNYSTELGNSLRVKLFTRNDKAFLSHGAPVTYDVKPGMEALAAQTWAVHGVCLSCNRWSLASSRCAECARDYYDPAHGHPRSRLAATAIQKQIDLARKTVTHTMLIRLTPNAKR